MDFPDPNPARAAAEAERLADEISRGGYQRIGEALLAAAIPTESRLCGIGQGMFGIAIDTEIGKFLAGPIGEAHTWAYETLVSETLERVEDADRAERIVVRGHAALVDGYATPIATLYGKYADDPCQKTAEDLTLAGGYAIPISPIKERHDPDLALRERVAEVRREMAAARNSSSRQT